MHPAEKYAHDVLAGRVVACKWVKLAAQRHLNDLRDGHKRGLHFDRKAAQHAIDFFRFLNHSKGEWAGTPFELEPWQQFIKWCVFGWKKADGTRRFRVVHEEIARKNGKSTDLAGTGLYMLVGDGEAGAEVYCAATKKDQARIVFEEALRMRKASPALSKRIQKFKNNMNVPETASKMEALGADEDTTDGLNISCGLVDELHAHKSRGMWDVLDTATGARKQALLWAITTAGFDHESICAKQNEYAKKVLEGLIEDDTLFAFIATLDDDDDPFDEANWIKANPNLGVSVKLDDLRRQANKAKNDPSSLNSFLRLRLNRWTSQETAAIKMDDWNACVGFPLTEHDPVSLRREQEKELEGRDCIIAVDLASTEDIAAALKLFPAENSGRPYIVLPRFYIPEGNVERLIRDRRLPYDVWIRDGFLTVTEGNVIDYDVIAADVVADFERYTVQRLHFDPWNATQFINDLQKRGLDPELLVKFPQTISNFAEPTKLLLETDIPNRQLAHLGNPVLRVHAANLIVREDNNGNRRPVKRNGSGKIDGMVALIMARAGMSGDLEGGSAYDGHELRVV